MNKGAYMKCVTTRAQARSLLADPWQAKTTLSGMSSLISDNFSMQQPVCRCCVCANVLLPFEPSHKTVVTLPSDAMPKAAGINEALTTPTASTVCVC